MFEKILVCVDPYAAPKFDLIPCAVPLKRLGAKAAVLAYVIPDDTHGLEKVLVSQVEPEMARQKKILEATGFEVTIEMPSGYPAHVLNALAEKHDVSIILIGSHGQGLLESMILTASALGNVSAKLLNSASRPVLLSRITGPAEKSVRKECPLFNHVLFATDFSDAAEIALPYLETMIQAAKIPVTLLHVQQRSRSHPGRDQRLPELRNLDRNRLQRLKLWLEGLGAPEVKIELPQGDPGEEIVKQAKRHGCSLILMGTQGKGIAREILLGSVAHQVARHAGQPVLFIPAFAPPASNY